MLNDESSKSSSGLFPPFITRHQHAYALTRNFEAEVKSQPSSGVKVWEEYFSLNVIDLVLEGPQCGMTVVPGPRTDHLAVQVSHRDLRRSTCLKGEHLILMRISYWWMSQRSDHTISYGWTYHMGETSHGYTSGMVCPMQRGLSTTDVLHSQNVA